MRTRESNRTHGSVMGGLGQISGWHLFPVSSVDHETSLSLLSLLLLRTTQLSESVMAFYLFKNIYNFNSEIILDLQRG